VSPDGMQRLLHRADWDVGGVRARRAHSAFEIGDIDWMVPERAAVEEVLATWSNGPWNLTMTRAVEHICRMQQSPLANFIEC
jgi:hypothetical protein